MAHTAVSQNAYRLVLCRFAQWRRELSRSQRCIDVSNPINGIFATCSYKVIDSATLETFSAGKPAFSSAADRTACRIYWGGAVFRT
jgi:hypothetical protein